MEERTRKKERCNIDHASKNLSEERERNMKERMIKVPPARKEHTLVKSRAGKTMQEEKASTSPISLSLKRDR